MAGRPRVVCIEGPSAAGKTTLVDTLERELLATSVPELAATGAPPIADAAAWFIDAHVSKFSRAQQQAAVHGVSLLDGDPFKGLWYNWIFADVGWPDIHIMGPLYRARVASGELCFPGLTVFLVASEAQLRQRAANDGSRTRRRFETHLRLRAPQQAYFAALHALDPHGVLLVDSSDRSSLPDLVKGALTSQPPARHDSTSLLESMIAWIATHRPDQFT